MFNYSAFRPPVKTFCQKARAVSHFNLEAVFSKGGIVTAGTKMDAIFIPVSRPDSI